MKSTRFIKGLKSHWFISVLVVSGTALPFILIYLSSFKKPNFLLIGEKTFKCLLIVFFVLLFYHFAVLYFTDRFKKPNGLTIKSRIINNIICIIFCICISYIFEVQDGHLNWGLVGIYGVSNSIERIISVFILMIIPSLIGLNSAYDIVWKEKNKI